MQSSRFDKRIKASKDDVNCSPCDCLADFEAAKTGSSSGRSVKLVYMPSERWNSMQF